MDWKAVGNIAALVGVLVAMVMMFNQVNGRIDRLQAETNARFDKMFERMDRMQAETNARFDVNERFDKMFDRMDRMQAETNARFDAANRRFDTVLDAILSFDRRVSRIEGRLDAQNTEAAE